MRPALGGPSPELSVTGPSKHGRVGLPDTVGPGFLAPLFYRGKDCESDPRRRAHTDLVELIAPANGTNEVLTLAGELKIPAGFILGSFQLT
jgi:hypothetical protein